MREMPAKSVASQNDYATQRQVVRPSDKQLSPVTETTLYPAEFSILLRGLMEGKTVEEVAQILDVPEKHVGRFLSGNWRPTKEMLKKMGLKVVYAMSEQHGAANC